jgi:hypothetical protein
MALLIARRISSVLSAFWFLSTIVASPAQTPDAGASSSEPHFVTDCRPCTFPVKVGGPSYAFTFDIRKTSDGRQIQAIDVQRPDGLNAGHLPVLNTMPVQDDGQFFFGGVDINFDGSLDLMLITRQGVANAYASYWLFDEQSKSFKPLGTFPVFTVDPQTHHLKTYERNGSGGMIYEAREYEFEHNHLVLMRDEKQDATAKTGVFRLTIRERVGNTLKQTSVKTVRAPASH